MNHIMPKKTNLSLEPYKGTRDFYPEDEFIQQYIFSAMKRVAERYGYEPYNASILEEAALYRAKSGEEIVKEQTYTFKDRGGREVSLRPEMTPTLARMIAKRRQELAFPLRWYSIPNVFRYERPQRGRTREHWQLNADVFGISGVGAELELVRMANDIMREFGAEAKDFEIRVNSRSAAGWFLYDIESAGKNASLRRLIDKKNKMPFPEFKKELAKLAGRKEAETVLKRLAAKKPQNPELLKFIEELKACGIANVRYDASLVRGFDYYTGIVFEVFDTRKENPRSLFGGGRYDELLKIFGVPPVPAAGFGMGDVTMCDYLETHKLLPEYAPRTRAYLCEVGSVRAYAEGIAEYLRDRGISVAHDLTGRKIGLQLKTASRQSVPFAVIVGEKEMKSKKLMLKDLKTHKEWRLGKAEAAKKIFASEL